MSVPDLTKLTIYAENDEDDLYYQIAIPDDWRLKRSSVRVTARGSDAFSYRTATSTVLVRPLGAFIPQKFSCESQNPDTSKCRQLSHEQYALEVDIIDTALRDLQNETIVGELKHSAVLAGKTANFSEPGFNCTSFGVQVWETFDLTVEQYIREFRVDADRFVSYVYPFIEYACDVLAAYGLHHEDLHLGNLMVNIKPHTSEIERIVVIDLGAIKKKKRSSACELTDMKGMFDEVWGGT